jgi:hypothetical protein
MRRALRRGGRRDVGILARGAEALAAKFKS